MAKEIYGSLKKQENLFSGIRRALSNDTLSALTGNESYTEFQSTLAALAGNEGFGLSNTLGKLNPASYGAFSASVARNASGFSDISRSNEFSDAATSLSRLAGYEGFSMQNWKGSELDMKAANMTLNAQSHLQTEAADELFKTISIQYEEEGIKLVVRAAGLGTYVYGANSYQSASDLRPIFGLLRTGEMFKDDVLRVYPVYPADDKADSREHFVLPAVHAPTNQDYPQGDAYGRDSHLTSMLKVPVHIENLLGLSEVPGQRAWTSTDELESNSIQIRLIAVKAKVGGKDVKFSINTTGMSNNTFGPGNQTQSSDDRSLNLVIKRHPGFDVVDKDGKAVGKTIFAAYKAAGYEPLLDISMTGNYQRQKNALDLNAGQVRVDAVRDISTGVVTSLGKADATVAALIRQLTEGAVEGALPSYNVTNNSRGNFGYRIEVFDATKHLSVRRKSPVSVKYPVSKDDVNQDSLNFALEQMSVTINNQCSKDAFDAAQDHLSYITRINGAAVVGNEQGSNVLPGQHFVTATAVNRKLSLVDTVSANGTAEVFEAVCIGLINEVSDITAALATKSGLAAIAEYGGVDKLNWTVIVHQNLARFLMRQGDARTIGGWETMTIKETNFDSMIGKILIVPKNTSGDDFINPLGGIGVNISKENIVVQGNVTRDQQDFGVVMTMPTYRHWGLCPIIGSLTVTDADKFLTDDGILSTLAKLRVAATGHLELENYVPPKNP